MMTRTLIGRPVIAGSAEGIALVSKEPLSFWGGYNANTGEIIDRRHERSGAVAAGRVFVFPQGKGSSTSSAVLLESIRKGAAPAAIINLKTDPILALGALPIVVLPDEDFFSISEGDHLAVEPDGTVKVGHPLK